ncbi:MAG TPA: hypothetical protein PL070_22160 [Flavobacteriales bacterium]|nr:hypothetical protein [Flavobacteriales bacterium]
MKERMNHIILLLALLVSGCAKHELDTATLKSNPFDADYDGPAVFTLISSSTTVEVINQIPTRVLTMRIKVHTEYFGRLTTYIVRVGNSNTPSNSIPDDVLTVRIGSVETGTEYCRELVLLNDGSAGARNTVCATAE